MKILQANKFFFRNGGSEVVMFQERDYLLNSGHSVIDFSMLDTRNIFSQYSHYFVSDQNYQESSNKFSKLNSAISLIHSSEAVARLTSLIDETQPDLMHCHNIYHQLSPSIIQAAKNRGIPVVLTLHDYKPICPVYNRLRNDQPCSLCLDGNFFNVLKHRCASNSFGKSALLFAEATVQRWLQNYENVDTFIAPSQFMQEAISHRIPPDRIQLLYNGVDTSNINASTYDKGYVLYIGRLSSEKGVRTLLEAHSKSLSKWSLVIAGTGPLHDELKSKYFNAEFIGHVNGSQLESVISQASIIVVPSEWYENCPMSVLEAMAHGKPVVGSRIGGIPELIVEGKTGLLYDAKNVQQLSDQIEHLMSNPELRKQMGKQARLRVEQKFSLEKHNADLIAIYQSLLKPA